MKAYIGIDVGSVSTDVAVISPEGDLLASLYKRTNGQPVVVLKESLSEIRAQLSKDIDIIGVGTTGSGRSLAAVVTGADIVKNEITAHAVAAVHEVPNVRTIFEIGGQDSKLIQIKDGLVQDFTMNTVCAAGTGSFLDQQAVRLGVPIEEFGDHALNSRTQLRIAGRCTVFAESDMIAKQQFGFAKEDIINGLCEALVRNFLSNLSRGRTLEPPFVFQGGVAANKGIRKAFEKEIGHPLVIPEHYHLMGAIGAALLSKRHIERSNSVTTFRGFDAIDLDFKPHSFECSHCPNHCEVIRLDAEGEPIAMWGDRCGRWSQTITKKKSLPA